MYKRVAKQSVKVLVVLNVDGSSPSGHPPQIPVSQELTGIFLAIWANLISTKINIISAKIH